MVVFARITPPLRRNPLHTAVRLKLPDQSVSQCPRRPDAPTYREISRLGGFTHNLGRCPSGRSGYRGDQGLEKGRGHDPCCFFSQLSESAFTGSVDGKEVEELSLHRLDLGDVDLEEADRMCLEGFLGRFIASISGSRLMPWRCYQRCGDERVRFGMVHFDTVFGFKPYRSLSSLSGAFDRCIAARMACVVVALPWSTYPITAPEVSGVLDRFHHAMGLNTWTSELEFD
jgi:hypothetical protein